VPPEIPVERTDQAFQGEILPGGAGRQWPQMDIRQMSER
jgi:hypothetical protein